MSSDNYKYFSVADLFGLNLPGYPATRQGWDALVKRESWKFRETKGLGGPGGIRREYTPPPEIMALIEARQRYEQPAAAPVRQPARPRGTVPVVAEDEEGMELMPPKVEGAALKCPGCGAFTGLIKQEGRVHLEFDVPDMVAFMQIAIALKPGYKNEDVKDVVDLTYRAFSVLSLITAGNQESISNLLLKPRLVNALATFCEELNANPPHDHSPPNKKAG